MDSTALILLLVGVVVGTALGCGLGWVMGRSGSAGLRTQLDAERTAAAERLTAEQAALRERLAESEQRAQQRFAEQQAGAEQRLADAERAFQARLHEERARGQERLDSERESAQLRLAELKADQKRLADEFAALSAKALADNSQAFLAQAEERLKHAGEISQAELAKREEAVRTMVEPLTKTLDAVKTEMTSAERARAQAHGALAEQVRAMQTSSERLRTETSQLVTALRAPQVRGRWGELQLRRVVEAAGMVAHVDFTEQGTVRTDEGLLRPDLVVHLPGEKNVVVDSKVAFNGYLEAMEATDEAVRAKRLTAHARHVRDHIDQLGAKAYWEHVSSTPEFVVMFIPADTFLNAALEQDPTLLERAFEKNVVLATPATLVALLRTVGYTWRQEKLAAEAQQVFEVGRELHKRLATVGKHLNDLSKRLNGTVESFNKLNRSLDSQLVTQARRFSALQMLDPALETPPPLEVLAVAASKEDLHETAPGGDEASTDAVVAIEARTMGGPELSVDARAEAERQAVLDADDDFALIDSAEFRNGDREQRERA